MNPFIREGRDGRRAPGYLVYLLVGAGAFAAVAVLHRESVPTRGSRAKGSERGGAPGNASAATQTASAASGAKSETGPDVLRARSVRSPNAQGQLAKRAVPDEKEPSKGSFDVIGAALAGPPGDSDRDSGAGVDGIGGEATALDEGASGPSRGPRFRALAPAFPPSTARGTGAAPEKIEATQLLGYRDPSSDVPSEGQAGVAPPVAQRTSPGLIPKGTLIRVYLLTTVDTSNPSGVIQFGVARDLVFNRRTQLEFGVRLLGRVSGKPMRDRVNLSADTVLYPDGWEAPLKASAVEADELGCDIYPGVSARFVPPPAWVQATPYAAELFAGVMGILQSRASQQLTLGSGGLALQSSTPDQVGGAAYQASAHAVDDLAQARLREFEERYAAHYLVPAGTACCLQLDADLDLVSDALARSTPKSFADRSPTAPPANEPRISGQPSRSNPE